MTPRSGLCGATESATGAAASRGISTMGRCGPDSTRADMSSMAAMRCAVARSGTITANGLSPRRFRLRSSATARSSPASQARWYPPMPLTASIAAVAQQLSGLAQRRFAFGDATVAGPVAQRRTAVRAADRLRVEPPVGGIVVFARTVGAHREAGHRGGGAVVRQRGDDGEARAAVGAVDEGVPVAPVAGVALFGGAFGAHGDIGGGERACRHRIARCPRS